VIGRLHLARAGRQRIEQTATALQELGAEQLVACHCTGFAARMRLHATFGDRFVNGTVGLRLTF
jgi:7,8-dihydropterin-6-yl-methyl-4-(beta-D-ribofuranosyl)aminobenzene 5'-phosphate synthase